MWWEEWRSVVGGVRCVVRGMEGCVEKGAEVSLGGVVCGESGGVW